jgi:CRP-like cAMP-binding protein
MDEKDISLRKTTLTGLIRSGPFFPIIERFIEENEMKENKIGKLYRDGEIVCNEGDVAENMYIIQSGRVEVIKNSPGGHLTIKTLEGGDFFGEMSLFDLQPRSATVKAVGDTRILTIDKKIFFSRLSEDPLLAFNILKGMSSRIRFLDNELSKFKKWTEGLNL